MRCEICGAPLNPDRVSTGVSRCEVCAQREQVGSQVARHSVAAMMSADSSPVDSSIVVEGKYRLEEELGRGAMGTVFAAQDMALKRRVAIKFLLPELAGSKECAERFHHEAVGMAAIRHNNVVQIYAYGNHGDLPYFAMEYLAGQTLEELVDVFNRRGFFVPLDQAFDILIQCLDGLCAIHRAGAVHRDLKPGNILLSGEPPRAVIMDFGLVRMVRMEEDIRALAGTPAYIAPELVEGQDGANRSPLIDIYSMGVTAYEVITGSLPFGGETWIEILRKHITEIPQFPSERRAGLHESVDRVLMRALSKDPRERHRSADELLADFLELRAALALAPQVLRTSQVPAPAPAPLRRPSFHVEPYRQGLAPRRDPKLTTGGVLRVLVADSDEGFRNTVHRVAKTSSPGCRVHSAADGLVALRLIEDFKPHVLVLGLELAEVNGLEIVGVVRGEPLLSNSKILVVAGRHGGHQEAAILRSMGIEHFLTKPVDEDELGELIHFLLSEVASLKGISGPARA